MAFFGTQAPFPGPGGWGEGTEEADLSAWPRDRSWLLCRPAQCRSRRRGGGGACSPPNPICLDPVSKVHLLVNEGQVCVLCWGSRLHARVRCAEVNRCAVLYKPGLGHPVFGLSAPSRSLASPVHFQIFLFFHLCEILCQKPPGHLGLNGSEW